MPYLQNKISVERTFKCIIKTLLINNKYNLIKIKFLMYKTLLNPVWTYDLKLWSNVKKPNLNKIQTLQN